MSQPQVNPEIFEQRLHEIEARIDTLQNSNWHDDVAETLRQHLAGFRDVLKEPPPVEEIAKIWRRDLESLEQRVGALVEKLANFETQSDRQGDADRSIGELLKQLGELRARNESGLAAIQQQIATKAAEAAGNPAESIRRDVASLKEIQTSVDRRTQDTFEAVYGTIEEVVDRLAIIENELRLLPQPPGKTARLRQAAVPGFDPDGSPGSGPNARRLRPIPHALNRIAASAPLPCPHPLAEGGREAAAEATEPVRARFVAAARRAAQAVVGEQRGVSARRAGEGRERKKIRQHAARNFTAGTLLQRLRPRSKAVMLGVSVVLLVLGAFGVAVDLFHWPAGQQSVRAEIGVDDVAESDGEPAGSQRPLADQPSTRAGANLRERSLPASINANALADETTLAQGPRRGVSPDTAAPPAIPAWSDGQTPAPPPPYLFPQAAEGREGTALPTLKALLQGTAGSEPAPQYISPATPDLTVIPLPPTIGGKGLLAAASAGDPGACYEVAIRFAEGRNTAQDLIMAAAWLERAARGGLAPAQFRLAVMREKGLGVKKDVTEARRLYVAAADKGHAKAMHNLAVLYSGGLDGKPDYALASQWFRKAAAHGVIDSQYNLAILYARGLGVERNFAESYKWFAVAAKGGDKDAARKRDEVAARLDPKQLESARLNAEAFLPVPQPDEATAIKAPVGGWDHVAAAATTKSKALVRPERFPGK